MAEADWSELTAPLRRAAQALAGSSGLLQRLGNDSSFWTRLHALNELPACVGFHPFSDTRQWSVDLERERQAGAAQVAERNAWSPRLTRQARRREQIALVSSAASAAGNAVSAARGAAPGQGGSTTDRSRDDTTVRPTPAAGPDVQSTGAWSALLQITQLVKELEAESTPRAPAAVSTSAALATRAGRTALPGESAGRGRDAAHTAGGASPAQSAGSTDATTMQATLDQPTALLEQYVAMLWAGAASPAPAALAVAAASAAAPPSSAGPAPRAASLLLPSRAQREVQPGPTLPDKAVDAGLPGFVWPANDEQTEESPEERINRALLEQAWLRGVDLT